ncbi:hypothetical protein EXS73_00100 [Candidatus Pacearchaeota archaeon]|nr:hypothetical protein [Candidatus Pacearchaeota archaeon]
METVGSLVDYGNYGRVYRLASDRTKVVKIPHSLARMDPLPGSTRAPLSWYRLNMHPSASIGLEHEGVIAEALRTRSFPAPRPYHVQPILSPEGVSTIGLASEYIHGTELNRLSLDSVAQQRPRIDALLTRVQQEGFTFGKDTVRNVLYNRTGDTLTLCDFGFWHFNTPVRASDFTLLDFSQWKIPGFF